MMSDLPAQGLFQQLNARPVSGEHLEVLGKKAAANWSSGISTTLNDAVTETVKHAGLSPEQVKRVIEFTNTEAYLTEFKKEGSHRVVAFKGGPADPSVILKDLNDGGGGSVFDRGTSDYRQPPRGTKTASYRADPSEKTASASIDQPDAVDDFFQKLASDDVGYPEVNPYGEVLELRDKLASQADNLTAQISGLETAYADLADRVYYGVKQAALSGRTLGEVVQVWTTTSPSSDHVKIAFQLFTPRLLREGVFRTSQELLDSTEKVGHVRMVNPRHPMVTDFQEYCETLSKLAELRPLREEVREGLGQLNAFMKSAATTPTGLIPRVTEAARKASGPIGRASKSIAEKVVGQGEGSEMIGAAMGGATKYSPHAAAVIGANEVRRHLKYSPTWNKFQSVANPQSDQYRQREMEIAQGGYGGY
jgi:hypothetical protein